MAGLAIVVMWLGGSRRPKVSVRDGLPQACSDLEHI